jgi:hypothetical protein
MLPRDCLGEALFEISVPPSYFGVGTFARRVMFAFLPLALFLFVPVNFVLGERLRLCTCKQRF